MRIDELLNRRSDLSSFVVHFTKDSDRLAWQNLEAILRSGCIEARSAMGLAREQDDPADASRQTQRVVSFTETPLEHAYAIVADIADRRVRLSPHGIAFGRMHARRRGANPIWYTDATPGKDWIAKAIWQLRDEAVARGDFHSSPIAQVCPFVELMGSGQHATGMGGYRIEFWWEREWRHVGHFRFGIMDVALGFCPEGEIQYFDGLVRGFGWPRYPQFVDPSWSLERMVARLSGLGPDHMTPFD